MDAQDTVLAFVEAWNQLDKVRIYGLMAADIVYHNLPFDPVNGVDAVRAGFAAWPVDACEWEMLNIATTGQTVLTERIDRFVRGADRIVIPVMGTFVVQEGKITQWRDYFDPRAMKPQVATA